MTGMVEQGDTTRARTDLSDLVRERRSELRLSLRNIEEHPGNRDNDGKPIVKRGWLERFEKGEAASAPPVSTLKALATALDLPLGRVKDAAGAQFLDLDTVWSESGEARAIVERLERYTPEQREQLFRLLETFDQSPRSS
ncbi:XRE family transcriptional regulator [Streptomyces sp. NPDC053079]|uniref:XRE family transcriptional regulator n=1 Tax=Streptomyces sp. NPDC053079 TaxID=3365697 RepID=UPI0037D92A81